MSILRGKQLDSLDLLFTPFIKWVNSSGEFILSVPDMYEKNGTAVKVRIQEVDLWRMIKADNKNLVFEFNEEQGDLDDDTYLGISYIQARYYLTINTLRVCKRAWKKGGKTGFSYLYLKKRTKRGGRPIGGGNARISEEEIERLEYVNRNYDKIVENLYEHDWAEEYVNLRKDIALYRHQKFIGKKACLKQFAVERRKYLE